jgi:serine/threonine protein kinase
VLGSGGFGIVYKCVDLSSGQLWAVKEIKEDVRRGLAGAGRIDHLKRSLIQEVETMAKISHVSNSSRTTASVDFEC